MHIEFATVGSTGRDSVGVVGSAAMLLSACCVLSSAMVGFDWLSMRWQVPTVSYKLINTFSHDVGAFTQGLHFESSTGTILESTGMYGESSARRVELESGSVLDLVPLPEEWFGEGITVQEVPGREPRVVQLLWRESLGLVRDARSLKLQRTFRLPQGMREGWGLTHDGNGTLFASDGTSTVHVLSGENLDVIRTLTVKAGGRALNNVNELQWVRGELWANIWRDDRIAAINPETGEVRCFCDLSGLLTPSQSRGLGYEEVLNGLAYDESSDRLFATGKCWPALFQIAIDEPNGAGAGRPS